MMQGNPELYPLSACPRYLYLSEILSRALHLLNQVLEGGQGGSCPLTGRDNDLSLVTIVTSLAAKNPPDAGVSVSVDLDFTTLVGFQQIKHEVGIGKETDLNKDTI